MSVSAPFTNIILELYRKERLCSRKVKNFLMKILMDRSKHKYNQEKRGFKEPKLQVSLFVTERCLKKIILNKLYTLFWRFYKICVPGINI
jgi:hypothetical protein